ncbi:DUF3857 domain-containing protein [Gramella sp. MT6]|uniref:DUF3857 domain-containing protein n=1 Tax=Gramella sp. MT6 TaxID=2705471 RepID=UPI001C5E72CC|nr:DUF3857 domain-containing protein [Gramella sp. MT6]QYA24194.1 DUF3857 domain-containing protein [Gramella sp. MT6]
MRQITLILSALFLCGFQIHSQNYKFGKVSKEEVLQKEHPIHKDANAAVLYRKQKVYYDLNQHEGLNLITEIHERIKIYNKEGFDWATKEIRRYTGVSDEEDLVQLKGYTYNIIDGELEEEKLRNDEIFEEVTSRYNENTKFTMPAVTEGSVIEITYKIKSPFLGSIGRTPLQYLIPMDNLELEVMIPEFFTFRRYFNLKSLLNFDLQEKKENFSYNFTSTSRSGNRVVTTQASHNSIKYMLSVYGVNRENIPPLKKEPHVENLHTYAAFIDWELMFTKFPNSMVENYSETWEGVARSIYNDLGIADELNKDNYYDEELDQVIAGLSDPRMKAEAIFEFVKQKVKWNDYLGFYPDNGTKKAFEEGSGNTGDINLLLISMLRYAKLKAHPVLLSTPSNGVPLYPTRDGFNYVIAGLELDGDLVLMDATDPKAAIGELPKRARNWQGRLLKEKEKSSWIDLMPNYFSENAIKMNYKFDGSGVEGWNWKSYSKLLAKKFRQDHSGAEQNNDIENRLSSISNIEISDYEIENKDKLGAEILEKFNFQLASASENIGDKVYLKPMLFDAILENPYKEEERYYPVYFDYPEVKTYSINIMIPNDYNIVSLPESTVVNLGEDDGQFKFIVNGAGNVIRLSSIITIKKTAFLPSEYDFLKKFYANIIKKHSEAIVLEKTLEDANSERAESGR